MSTKMRGDYFFGYDHILNPCRAKYWVPAISQPLKSLMNPQPDRIREEFASEEAEWPEAKNDAAKLLEAERTKPRVKCSNRYGTRAWSRIALTALEYASGYSFDRR